MLQQLTDHGVVEEQDGLIALDEPHAPHVRGQVVHLITAFRHRHAVGQSTEVGVREHATELLLPETKNGKNKLHPHNLIPKTHVKNLED